MAVFELFSSRQKRQRGEGIDVFAYDTLPDALRVQIVQIWWETIGGQEEYHEAAVKNIYEALLLILRRERGVFRLPPEPRQMQKKSAMKELADYFLTECNVEYALDVIELTFRFIDKFTRNSHYLHRPNADELATAAIEELNQRFKQHGVGYQFVNNELIRVDSQFAHAEVVKPALALLNNPNYAGAQDEFLQAYEFFRHGKHKDALNNALKAMESVLKSICTQQHWTFDRNDTCNKLIAICVERELIPSFWLTQFNALRTLLESGVPTGRNKLGGHGQGAEPVEVPEHIVAYVLHMAAAAIVFLVEAEISLHSPKEKHVKLH